jgi:hypothetical protein
LVIINEDTHTRLTATCTSSPDISLISPSLALSSTWTTEIALPSDHLPITIGIATEPEFVASPKRTFVNFKKANWDAFTLETEQSFAKSKLPEHPDKAEKAIRNIITKAAKKYIPAGRIPQVKPNYPSEAIPLTKERDDLRKSNPASPRITTLNREITKLVNDHRKTKWIQHLEAQEPNTKALWNTIKSISNPRTKCENQPITFETSPVYDNKKAANLFNRQFTPPTDTARSKESRGIRRKLRQKNEGNIESISPAHVHIAILSAKSSKAFGPDNITTIHLKHLGIKGIDALTEVFNKSLKSSIIPDVWKKGKIIPILKPGKPADKSTSYRPITLLSPIVKILERCILPVIVKNFPVAEHQHGFRKGRSTTTALTTIANTISKGLNKKKPVHRTILVALDLSRAFDTVNHDILLKDIQESTLPNSNKKWLASYLSGRQTIVEFRNTISKTRIVRQGVPQGGVLSPILFNLYMSKMPEPPPNTNKVLVTYADDSSILASGPKVKQIVTPLNHYLNILAKWFRSRHMSLSVPKSTATLFTTATKEVNEELGVVIDGNAIPTVKQPKLLGVVFDNLHTFAHHVKYIKNRVSQRNRVLKALAGTTWGKTKETIMTTYKAIGRSVINYAAPVWTPNVSDSRWNELQAAQNNALRCATGCHRITSTEHLHQECKMLPVKEHNHLLSKQFLLACHDPEHPNHNITESHQQHPERLMRPTLATTFSKSVSSFVPEVISKKTMKMASVAIHTDVVSKTKSQLPPNPILGTEPPQIDPKETSLDRSTRCTLAQLRCGHSKHLKSYMARIAREDPTCPSCKKHKHTTKHLFKCPANPTTLQPRTLWEDTRKAATFLNI